MVCQIIKMNIHLAFRICTKTAEKIEFYFWFFFRNLKVDSLGIPLFYDHFMVGHRAN